MVSSELLLIALEMVCLILALVFSDESSKQHWIANSLSGIIAIKLLSETIIIEYVIVHSQDAVVV